MTIQLADAVAAVERLKIHDRNASCSPIHESLEEDFGAEPVETRALQDDLELVGNFILGLSSEQADGSTFKKLFDQFSNGGEFSVETREVDGNFQQRAVLKGVWESAEKPSGLS